MNKCGLVSATTKEVKVKPVCYVQWFDFHVFIHDVRMYSMYEGTISIIGHLLFVLTGIMADVPRYSKLYFGCATCKTQCICLSSSLEGSCAIWAENEIFQNSVLLFTCKPISDHPGMHVFEMGLIVDYNASVQDSSWLLKLFQRTTLGICWFEHGLAKQFPQWFSNRTFSNSNRAWDSLYIGQCS